MLDEYTLAFAEARVEYRARKPDGTLDTPVIFQQVVTGVEDFKAAQRALIDRELGALPHDIVLRLPGISGESVLNGYSGQIDVESFSWGGDARLGLVGGGGVGAPELRELHLVSRVSKASPKLIDALGKGIHLADAELSFLATATRGERVMRITLEDVLVSSYQTTTDNDGTLMEEVTLSFADAEWEYRPLQSNGSVGAPVTFAAQQIPVEDFAPTQRSILPGVQLIPTLQAFVEIDGIPGESTDVAHEDEIDLLSFSWGADAAYASGGGGGGAGRPQFHEVHFVAHTSSATPRLLDRLSKGMHIPDARLVLRRGGDKPADFFTIKLADVVVSSYQVTTARDGYLLEEITLAFGPGGSVPPTAVTLTGTAGADTFYLRKSGSGIAVFTNESGTGTPVQVVGSGQGILVNMLAGDDLLVLDQSAGDLVVPDGLLFTGGDGADTLRILNATGNAAINQQGVTTIASTQVNHGTIENVELNGILIGLLLPAVQSVKVAGNDGLLTVQNLTLEAGARLDLGTNDLRVLGGDAATIEALLKTARNGTAPWQGPGIGTTAATALTGLAAVQQGPDVFVKLTYNGDANGDGRINADDYFRIDSGFLDQPANPLYGNGDFNFDDTINADDYFLIDSAFLGQAQALSRVPLSSISVSSTLEPADVTTGISELADARKHPKRHARPRFSDTVISSTRPAASRHMRTASASTHTK
jgi:type VI secretion system secreted protein Hcp